MRLLSFLAALFCVCAPAQNPSEASGGTSLPEEFRVYTEAPRLFLNARRARLVRRERERESMRWQQFRMLMAGKAPMPEAGMAYALYYQATGDAGPGKQAIEWALSPGADLRQQAIVFDWCAPLLTAAQADSLASRLQRGIEQTARAKDIPSVSARTLAAVALADRNADLTEKVLRSTVLQWWGGYMAPALKRGEPVASRDDTLPLFELLHVVRDNSNIDLREGAAAFFKNLPALQLLTYYPAPWPAPENEYRIPVYYDSNGPDLRRASLSRAAEYALVAYDSNALESQFVQGWLIQDRFLMRSPLGIVYEMLWANPYQPGLSYFHMPLAFHDEARQGGALVLRSSWDDDATWFSLINGKAQVFDGGKRQTVEMSQLERPLRIGTAAVTSIHRFQAEADLYFVVGLKPNTSYDVEVDDEEMREVKTDAGGVLELPTAGSIGAGVCIHDTGKPLIS